MENRKMYVPYFGKKSFWTMILTRKSSLFNRNQPIMIITIGISGASCADIGHLVTENFPKFDNITSRRFFQETNLANGECPDAIDFNSFISTLCELRTSASLVKTFKSKKVQIRNNVESTELDNLTLKLNAKVQNVLMKTENELNFVFIDGFLLYVNPDVVK
ncbi:2970_t:CDS:2, partial [Funneliformis mosseae]